ncbi:YiiD C-terminal domain-containing protein [Aliamphritea hakodatensis]|uniref:YiiD C-terminal domain-containing protein n=1 Tax=Aliamphritea hakodatensis TaxID=2895352 RepID=UPI0022FD9500|nr:YiiD C-terminal domain-containing protein [Aliamphritea hakodatensis]
MTSMASNSTAASSLEALLHREIPASKAFSIQVSSLDSGQICLEAPVAENNINIHGTAFAGSIYSMSALAAWALMFDCMQRADCHADLVIAKANIQYQRPAVGSIIATTRLSDETLQAFFSDLEENGKARLEAHVDVFDRTALRATNQVCLVAISRSSIPADQPPL